MDPALVISPHLDDAILSAGQFLAGWPGTAVLTIFAGVPPGQCLTEFDRNSGFRSSQEAVQRRQAEDLRATATVKARAMHLDFLDGQYRQEPDLDLDAIADRIHATEREVGACTVMGPLGLVHPDHVKVRDAFLTAATRFDVRIPIWLYEDLPSRVLYPESIGTALHALDRAGWTAQLDFPGTGPKEAKRAAVRNYQSQAWALDTDTLYVPERFWKLTR